MNFKGSKIAFLSICFLSISAYSSTVIPTEEFNEEITKKELALDKLLEDYKEKYSKLAVFDLSLVERPEFERQMNDLVKMEGNLDDLIKEELDSLAKSQLKFALQLKDSGVAGLESKIKEVQDLYTSYELSRAEYGGAKDYKRYAAFTDLFFKTQEVYDLANNGASRSKVVSLLNRFTKIANRVKNFLQYSVKLSIPAFQMFLSAFQNITKTKVGFGQSVDQFFEKWGKDSGISVEVRNGEYLKKQERLRLYVPTHRDANLDAVAFAALKVEDPAVFGALNLKNHPIFGLKDNPLVKPLIDSLSNNDTFILAGAPEKPIDKFLRLYKENRISNALIYAEGQVGLGIKESRPVRENFSSALLKRLIEENIDFELIPVTYVNGSQYFEYHNEIGKINVEKGQNQLVVNVQSPVRSNQLKEFFKKFDPKFFNTYLRFMWLFDMDTNKNLILGQGRWTEIQSAFQSKISKSKSCSESMKELLLEYTKR